MNQRTSLTHPLLIDEVGVPGVPGRIGITFCPGKKQSHALTGAWNRDLRIDLDAIQGWGAATVITLLEAHEFKELKVPDLGAEVQARGMAWVHLPIRDGAVPGQEFEAAWAGQRPHLTDQLYAGRRVLVHCKGGLGRAGIVAALLLVELGLAPNQAIRAVRSCRKGAIETRGQEEYVLAHAGRGGGMAMRGNTR